MPLFASRERNRRLRRLKVDLKQVSPDYVRASKKLGDGDTSSDDETSSIQLRAMIESEVVPLETVDEDEMAFFSREG